MASGRAIARLAALIERRLGLFEDRRSQPFGTSAIDRYENVASCGVFPLLEQ